MSSSSSRPHTKGRGSPSVISANAPKGLPSDYADREEDMGSSYDDHLGNETVASGSASVKSRFSRTSKFLQKFKGSSSVDKRSSGAGSSKTLAGQSSASLNKASASDWSRGHRASSVGAATERRNHSPAMVPVPAIPERFAKSSARGETPSSDVGKTSKRATDSSPVKETVKLSTASGSQSPSQQRRGTSSQRATTSTTSPSKHLAKSSNSSAHGMSTESSGSEMRSTLRAWETEMDDALKESAQNLESKTRFTDAKRWTPTPELPPLGIELDASAAKSQQDTLRSRGATSSTSVATAGQRGNGTLTPSASGNTENSLQEILNRPRPWERSTSPFLQSPSPRSGSKSPTRRKDVGTPEADRSLTDSRASRANGNGDTTPTPPSRPGSANTLNPPPKMSREYSSIGSVRSFDTALENASSTVSDSPTTTRSRTKGQDARGVWVDDDIEEPSIRLVVDPQRANGDADVTPTGFEGDSTTPSASPVHLSDGSLASSRTPAMNPRRQASALAPLPGEDLSRSTGKGSPVAAADQSIRSSSAQGVRSAKATEDHTVDEATAKQAQSMAAKCWGSEDFGLPREKIAEWLGGQEPLKQAARTFYFESFDFRGMRIDAALRHLCDKLYLRAETQQIDRILSSFSQRFYQCNQSPVYESVDSIHAIVFSLLLLNTDLHVADISERMTQKQFVRNIMSALSEQQEQQGSPEARLIEVISPAPSGRDSDSISIQSSQVDGRGPTAGSPMRKAVKRSSVGSLPGSNGAHESLSRAGGTSRAAQQRPEAELEALLKDMYVAVKLDRIRLPMTEEAIAASAASRLKPVRPGLGPPSASDRGSGRASALKRTSMRGLQGLLGASHSYRSDEGTSPGSVNSMGSRSMTDASSGFTQTPSSSRTSNVTEPSSKGSGPTTTLGFANTLSHAMVKESQDEDPSAGYASTAEDLDDNELSLLGPPWAKEGVLSRKHYWDAPHKRAKDKNWAELFVVVQKGTLSMFKFGEGLGSSQKSVSSKQATVVGGGSGSLGGGNWLSNATSLGEISLAHTLSNALPPPGYNRDRPHVFALTVPSGAVYFFQAGTEDLVQEWVSTCNYWAARSSRQPLAGGVSNMEYGWNKVLPRQDDEDEEELNHADKADDEGKVDGLPQSPEGPGWSAATAGPPDASIYRPGNTLGIDGRDRPAAAADNRSVLSGRSGRSVGSKYQTWQEAASTMLSSRGNRPIEGGSSSRPSRAPSFRGPSRKRPTTPSLRSFNAGGNSHDTQGTSSSMINTNDRLYINEWKAPAPPTAISTLSEEDQTASCIQYLARVTSELTTHNELRGPMLSLYSSTKSQAYQKALGNWEKKSNYLLTELVRWQGYVEALNVAGRLKGDKRDERAMDLALARADEEMSKVKNGGD